MGLALKYSNKTAKVSAIHSCSAKCLLYLAKTRKRYHATIPIGFHIKVPLHLAIPIGCYISSPAQIPVEAAWLHDAVWVYARALAAVLSMGEDPHNGRAIAAQMRNTTYRSVMG